MRLSTGFGKLAALVITLAITTATNAAAQTETGATATGEQEGPAWRSWTSQDGAEIEAFLKNVVPEGIVIVRRDGLEFTAPLSRFSAEDQAYVAEWLQSSVPNVSDFRDLDLSTVELPDEYMIENVEQIESEPREPVEAGAIQTILTFHDVPLETGLADRIAARKPSTEQAIPASGISNVLANLPVETEIVTGGEDPSQPWEESVSTIRAALSKDLPVMLVYRPYYEPETPEEVVVAIGYDRRDLRVLEPTGSDRPVGLDIEGLEEQLIYALILFPSSPATALSTAPTPSGAEPTREFLSQVSSAILKVPEYEPEALTEFLNAAGIQAILRDVNRADLREQMGQTRSFARSGGLPLIDASLENGHVVIVPLEVDGGQGFALIYGQTEENFLGVEFLADRTFQRAPIPRADLAQRWLTRDDRTYRLDLIEIAIPPGGAPVPPPPPTEPPPSEPPPSRPPPY